jgi:hypothetical protein
LTVRGAIRRIDERLRAGGWATNGRELTSAAQPRKLERFARRAPARQKADTPEIIGFQESLFRRFGYGEKGA